MKSHVEFAQGQYLVSITTLIEPNAFARITYAESFPRHPLFSASLEDVDVSAIREKERRSPADQTIAKCL
jgi:hypothetical protein